jgi:hypothetical protein
VHNAPFYPEGSWIDRIGDTWVFNPGREPGPIPTHLNGILILVIPRLLNFIVAIYLIIIGLVGLFNL